ncbi:thermostable hemolysin [Pseudoxanthomonas kalamensis DSM 18571]|uniref:thermostable hemolysin n=1 Tax=Pseudoxanthomonas kalamensis TaxID=289483 RepID=UPI0013920939|nr:thermostable hemolysin [Pseudoxanthomonas kalamensis]KAF1712074.1 thermostable hemolysin [Pseudoxanthomonas kalamensis DSM 18571]
MRKYSSPYAAAGRANAAQRIDPNHPQRGEVEAFIAEVYRQRFDTRLHHFLPHLLAFRDDDDRLRAAVGLRRADEGALFVEQYLDAPVEHEIGRALRREVERRHVVEVGNFAARDAGDARRIIEHVTGVLHRADLRWVVLVATRQLRNAFDRLQLSTSILAPAQRERLTDDGTDWGRYYDTGPQVVYGNVAAGQAFLSLRATEASDDAPAVLPCPCLAMS